MLSPNNVKQSLHVDVAISGAMANALQTWSLMYTNQATWLSTEIKSLNLPAAIAAEISRAVTIEMELQISGSPRADFLALQMIPVLNNIRTYTEYCSAKGGLMFKPYFKDEFICVDFVQADMFYPIAFDANGNMTAVVFADQKQVGANFYTRLEYHAPIEGGYQIANTAYKSNTREMLGSKINLGEIADWADIEPEATILNIDRPLFAYFKMPFANNIDPTSPLGVSVYSRAVAQIQNADEIYNNLIWEFESGKRAIYADTDAYAKDSAGLPILPNKRLYRALNSVSNIGERGKLFEDWSPEFREAQIKSGLNDVKREIEFLCGLAFGTISDPQAVALTATEVIISKQRTAVTIKDTQKSLEDALNQLIYAMDVWTTIYSLAPKGTYETAYTWDDSIVTDYDAQFTQDSGVVTMGAMPKYVFLMRNYGLDEATAKQWVTESQTLRVPLVKQ